MYHTPKRIITFLSIILVTTSAVYAQRATTSSPYSQYGIGQLRGDFLPQTRALGGMGAGIRYQGGLNNINITNPASYSAIGMTTMDAGIFGNITELSNTQLSEQSYNFALSHIAFGIPLSRAGGVSFGILPFSDVGYNYAIAGMVDTLSNRTVYRGNGGTTKAYLGYGVNITNEFSVGFNAGYVFGTLNNISAVEYPNQITALNTHITDSRYVKGFSIDYGAQFYKRLSNTLSLTIGYSGTLGTPLDVEADRQINRTYNSASSDDETVPSDSILTIAGLRGQITMPMKHNLGFSLARGTNWLVGAELNYASWSDYREGDSNPGFNDSYGFAVGGQFIPDVTSVRYWNLVEYRLGLKYNRSYLNLANQDINQTALTVGFGFPLPSLFGNSFYKINLAAELGQMGSTSNNLVRERYANFTLGFTLNDRWFMRRPYD